eukprot:4710125-Amphidinium_carterae.1
MRVQNTPHSKAALKGELTKTNRDRRPLCGPCVMSVVELDSRWKWSRRCLQGHEQRRAEVQCRGASNSVRNLRVV